MNGPCTFCTFQWLAHFLLWLLEFIHFIFRDWGLAIIILVLIVRLILHPITKRAQINMTKMGKQMQTLQPEIEKLKKKYKVPEPPDGEELQIGPDTPQSEIDAHVQKRAEAMYAGVDVVGYVGEVMGLLLEMPEMADRPLMPQETLTGLEVKGDKATAKAGDRELSFVKEGGRWYLSSETLGG